MVHGVAIAAVFVVVFGEVGGERVLIYPAIVPQDGEDGKRHLRIISRVRAGVTRSARQLVLQRTREIAFPESIADGETLQGTLRGLGIRHGPGASAYLLRCVFGVGGPEGGADDEGEDFLLSDDVGVVTQSVVEDAALAVVFRPDPRHLNSRSVVGAVSDGETGGRALSAGSTCR